MFLHSYSRLEAVAPTTDTQLIMFHYLLLPPTAQVKNVTTVTWVKHFFHYVFSTNSFLPFTWFLLNPFMYFALQFSRHVFSTDVIHAFYPTFFDSRDLHLSRSCILPYVFSMMCFTLKLITHFNLGFFQHVFSTKAFHTFYPRFFRARAFH